MTDAPDTTPMTKPAAKKTKAVRESNAVKRAPAAKKTKAPVVTQEAPVAKKAVMEAPTTDIAERIAATVAAADTKTLLAAGPRTAEWSFAGQWRAAKCVKVYDGDTAHFVFVPAPGLAPARFVVRMAGYNSAEVRTKDPAEKEAGIAAREFLAAMILKQLVVLHLGPADKYGRLLAEVYLVADSSINGRVVGAADEVTTTAAAMKVAGSHVNAVMMAAGHGKPYTGRGEKKW